MSASGYPKTYDAFPPTFVLLPFCLPAVAYVHLLCMFNPSMALPSAARQSLRAFQVPFPYPFLAMCALCVGRFIFLSVRASSVYFVSLAGLYPAGKLADTMCITLPNVPFPRFKKGLI